MLILLGALVSVLAECLRIILVHFLHSSRVVTGATIGGRVFFNGSRRRRAQPPAQSQTNPSARPFALPEQANPLILQRIKN